MNTSHAQKPIVAASGPIIQERVDSGKVKVVSARYDLLTGKVELLKQ